MTTWRERHRARVAALENAAATMMLTAMGDILDLVALRFASIVADSAGEAEARASLDDLAAIATEWQATVDHTVLPWFGGIYRAGAEAAEIQVAELASGILVPPASSDLIDHAAADYLAQAQARFYGLGEETWAAARAQLLEGFQAGEGIDALRRRITDSTDLARAQAEALARTEVIAASNMGADARIEMMGADAPPYKQWLATDDARTRPTHRDADGQVVPRTELFQVGAAHLRVPGDPSGPAAEVINCRCTPLYLETPEPLDPDGRGQGGPVDIVADEATVTPGRVPHLTAATGPPQVDSTTGEPHTGAMVALIPDDPEAFTLPDGEPVDLLHVTLAFLGEAQEIPAPSVDAIMAAAETVAAGSDPLDVNVFGASVWNTTGDTPSLNLAIGGEGLAAMHDLVWAEIIGAGVEAAGWVPPANHTPWVPHMCVLYGDHEYGLEPFYGAVGAATQLEGPIRLGRLRVALGGESFDFELTGSMSSDAAIVAADNFPANVTPQEGTMPWEIRQGGDDCPFEVVKQGTDERAGCHQTREEAEEQLAALYANEGDAAAEDPTQSPAPSGGPAPQPGEHLRAVMHLQGSPTGANDTGRQFLNLTYRATPFAYHWSKTSAAHGGQPTVVHVGNVVRVVEEGDTHYGFVQLDMDSPDGAEYARRVVAGFERWVSIGADETKPKVTAVWPEPDPDEDVDDDDEDLMKLFAEPELVVIDGVRVAELTSVSVPAQADATIEPTDELRELVQPADEDEDVLVAAARQPLQLRRPAPPAAAGHDCGGSCGGTCDDCAAPTTSDLVQAVTAAAYTIEVPELPPAAWFQEPTDVELDGAFNITDQGRIYGMLAPLGTSHRAWARSGGRMEVPFGNVDYGRFMGAWALTADGKVAAGPLTMDCGHAPRLRSNHQVGPDHYENACSSIGAIAVGESKRLGGVWVAGALLPGVRPDQVARALTCRCSGDWQPHPDKAGWTELIAALLVPSPGFGTAHPERMSTTTQDGVLVASSAPVHFVPTIEDRRAVARAGAVRRLIDGAGRSPAARVLAATQQLP